MARIEIPDGEGPEMVRVLQHHSKLGGAVAGLAGAIYGTSTLSKRERECVRMRVAQLNQCQICLGFRFPELEAEGVTEKMYAAVAEWRVCEDFSERERLAIEYTERFITDHLNLDEDFFARLRSEFCDAEVFDLTCVVAGLMANGRIMQVLQVEQACAIPEPSPK